jgi:chromosome segregation ATPase
MENENKNTYMSSSKLKGNSNKRFNNPPVRSDFNKNKNLNNNIFEKKINFKNKQNIDINNDQNINMNFNELNNNVENVMDKLKMNEMVEPVESNLSSNIYDKNIAILNEKIKEQENDIIYLNERLKNYDATMDEMTKLNIEVDRLNEIIRDKNNTIQEFREITELSKQKFEQLIMNKKELIQRINFLEKENEELRNKNKPKNILKEEEYNPIKSDLDGIKRENQELKKLLQEKDEEIEYMNNIIQNSNKNFNRYMNYTTNNRNNNFEKMNYRHGDILRTEPNNYDNIPNSYSIYERDIGINKYNYLKNKYRMEPLKFSNYLLDNLQNNISNNYLNIK